MANSITGNPWKLDTTGVITTAPVYIKNLMWVNATTGSLVITDNAGRDIIRDTWSATKNLNYGEIKWIAGMNLVTIGSGELIVVVHK